LSPASGNAAGRKVNGRVKANLVWRIAGGGYPQGGCGRGFAIKEVKKRGKKE